jgi:hypothetical protein
VILNAGLNPDERFDRGRKSIRHQFEFTIRWNEGDRSVVFESGETDTLMKFNILHLDGLSSISYITRRPG